MVAASAAVSKALLEPGSPTWFPLAISLGKEANPVVTRQSHFGDAGVLGIGMLHIWS